MSGNQWASEAVEAMALQFTLSVSSFRNKPTTDEETLIAEAQGFCAKMKDLMAASQGLTTSPPEKRYISSGFEKAAKAIEDKAKNFNLPSDHDVKICIQKLRDRAQVLRM